MKNLIICLVSILWLVACGDKKPRSTADNGGSEPSQSTEQLFEKKGTVSLDRQFTSLVDLSTPVDLRELAQNQSIILVFIDPVGEPSRNVMSDIPAQCAAFEKWGGNMLIVLPDEKISADFSPVQYKGLPKQATFVVDADRKVMNALLADLKTEFKGDFPVELLITPQGEVMYLWQGYRAGIANDLIKAIQVNKL